MKTKKQILRARHSDHTVGRGLRGRESQVVPPNISSSLDPPEWAPVTLCSPQPLHLFCRGAVQWESGKLSLRGDSGVYKVGENTVRVLI